MEKLTKENIYIDLRGKSKEELTDLYNFLISVGEKHFRKTLNDFLANVKYFETYIFFKDSWSLAPYVHILNKTKVTIEQLKEILQPMGKFTPIAMKCTQEQFEAIKPKLKGLEIEDILSFADCNYLVNNLGGEAKVITNFRDYAKACFNRTVHETWDEEIFLKACGIEVDSLEQQLQKAEAEVKRLKDLINAKDELKRIQKLIESLENESRIIK